VLALKVMLVPEKFRWLAVVAVCGLAAPGASAQDGPVCYEPELRSIAADLFPEEPTTLSPSRSSLLVGVGTVLDDGGSDEADAGTLEYSLGESLSWGVSYHHALLFDTASNEELRKHRMSNFSTARERDVFDLGVDWKMGDNTLGVGYQLQSKRPDRPLGPDSPSSILPQSEDVGHAFTLGVTREWGGGD